MVARRRDDDALARAVGPVRQPAPGELARRLLPADAFVHPPHPERLAVLGIERRSNATRGGDGEQAAVRVERRRAIVLVLTEGPGVPLPGDLQLAEVRRVDLIERRVARAPGVGAPVAPLARHVAAHERRRPVGARLVARHREGPPKAESREQDDRHASRAVHRHPCGHPGVRSFRQSSGFCRSVSIAQRSRATSRRARAAALLDARRRWPLNPNLLQRLAFGRQLLLAGWDIIDLEQIRDRLCVLGRGQAAGIALGHLLPDEIEEVRQRTAGPGRPERGGRVGAPRVTRHADGHVGLFASCRLRGVIDTGHRRYQWSGKRVLGGMTRLVRGPHAPRHARRRHHNRGGDRPAGEPQPAPSMTRFPQTSDTLAVLGNLVETRGRVSRDADRADPVSRDADRAD